MRACTLFVLAGIGLTPAVAQKQRQAPPEPPPIVRTNIAPPPIVRTVPEAPRPIITPNRPFGMWDAQDFGDHAVAHTTNESGSVFGMICGTTCLYYVNFQKDCVKGDNYPAMINGPSGAYPITLRCYHLEDKRILTFKADEQSIGIMEGEGDLGFAFPLENGRFGVSRFTLVGGLDAVTAVLDAAIKKQNTRQEGLRDFTI